MLNEALVAAEMLADSFVSVRVVAMPWLNRVDLEWLETVCGEDQPIAVLEDHAPVGALGDTLRRSLRRPVECFGVEGWPACGTPVEALRHHRLDGRSVAARLGRLLEATVT
jgi:transketolase